MLISLEVHPCPTAPNVTKVFIVEKVLSTKHHVQQNSMEMNRECQLRSALVTVQQAFSV